MYKELWVFCFAIPVRIFFKNFFPDKESINLRHCRTLFSLSLLHIKGLCSFSQRVLSLSCQPVPLGLIHWQATIFSCINFRHESVMVCTTNTEVMCLGPDVFFKRMKMNGSNRTIGLGLGCKDNGRNQTAWRTASRQVPYPQPITLGQSRRSASKAEPFRSQAGESGNRNCCSFGTRNKPHIIEHALHHHNREPSWDCTK